MTREVTLAATQFACSWDIQANLETAERLVREAAGRGAQIVLLQELFATPYFPITQDTRHFDLAGPAEGHPVIARFSRLAGELGVVLPVSFFERAGQAFFNSVAIIDADGAFLGVYRKSHIPDSGGYQEKYYFSPGDTGLPRLGHGLRAHRRRHLLGPVVPGERARMALQGAEVLLYPTAIGSDPPAPDGDSRDTWQLAQRGHAIANAMPVVASNRIGVEAAPAASRASASTARRSSPPRPAPCWPRRRATARRWSRRPSTSTSCATTRGLELLPRPPARAVRVAARLDGGSGDSGREASVRTLPPGRRGVT